MAAGGRRIGPQPAALGGGPLAGGPLAGGAVAGVPLAGGPLAGGAVAGGALAPGAPSCGTGAEQWQAIEAWSQAWNAARLAWAWTSNVIVP